MAMLIARFTDVEGLALAREGAGHHYQVRVVNARRPSVAVHVPQQRTLDDPVFFGSGASAAG